MTHLFIHIVCEVMEPFFPFLSLSLSLFLFLDVHAGMSTSCQSSTPFCAHPSIEIPSLLEKPITLPLLSASQLISWYSQTAFGYGVDSQQLQSIVSQHIFDQRILIYYTFSPNARLQHLRAPLSDWFHYSWSELDYRNCNYCTTMLVLSQCTINLHCE